MTEAYPLCWPVGQRRTLRPERSRFEGRTLTKVTLAIKAEVQRMQGSNVIISTNIPVKLNGEPHINYQKRIITDKGVAVYFVWSERTIVLCCDKWDSIEDNLWAVAKSIEAMRSLERWGVSDILEQAFTGFTAIPERAESSKSMWEVLDMQPTKDKDLLSRVYRLLAAKRHPNRGGSHVEMVELNLAYEQAVKHAGQ